MSNPKTRFKAIASSLFLLTAAACGVYLSNTASEKTALVEAVPGGIPESAASSLDSAVAAPVALPAAPASVTPIAAQVPAPVQTGAPISQAYRFKGALYGQPLSRTVPAVTQGPEKGRVMEMERLSAAELESWAPGQTVRLATPEGEMSGLVNLVQKDEGGWVRVGGSLKGQAGSFTLAASISASGGLLMLPSTGIAYEVVTEADGRVLMVERRLSDKRCFVNQIGAMRPYSTQATTLIAATTPPTWSSRPDAPAVVYLDFDGETVTDPGWNNGVTIVALAPTLTQAEILQIFNRVKEDFAPFNVDITTDLSRYNAVPANRRTRCIITPTNTAAPGAGGVAYVGAFNSAGTSLSSTVPCWVFNGGVVGIAEAISHEVGHTMGLIHDGRTSPVEGYYAGQGTGATSWAPIMGVGYYVTVAQWSKGEYLNANNKEDDLAIIASSANGITYITDEAGTSAANAAPLTVTAGSINQTGLITGATDADYFQFTSTGGAVSITASPGAVSPNLDIQMQLRNSSTGALVTATGSTINPANPVDALAATLSASTPAGTYTLIIAGTGKGIATGTGYSSYGSLGPYTLSGTISAISLVPSITSSALSSAKVGTAFSYQVTATNTPTSYGVSGLPAGITPNLTTGLLSGTPTVAGTFPVVLTATNASGTGSSFTMTLTVSPAVVQLTDAIDLTGYSVTSGGASPWLPVTAGSLTYDGVDSAASGKITHGGSSSMSISVVGPKKLSFRWKVSSEASKDNLSLVMDNTILESISGETSWALRTLSIPNGTHTIEWRYSKDSSMSVGLDAGWVDTVSVAAADALSLYGTLSFGKVAIGSSGTSSFTIANNGTTSISVTGITYPAGFTGPGIGTITAGSSKVVGVTFSPTGEAVYSGTLTVASNAASGDPVLPVSGEGITSLVNLVSGGTLTSQGAPAGSSRTYKISVPVGSTALKVVTSGGTGDVDLYLKRGVLPSPTDTGFLGETDGNAELINVANPVAGDWYILLYGYQAYAGVSLTATVTAPISSFNVGVSSSGNGTVTGGGSYASGSTAVATGTPSTGYFFESWTEAGTVRSTTAAYSFTVSAARTLVANFNNVRTLVNNVQLTSLSGTLGSQTLYKIAVPANTGMLSIKSSGGTGDVDLYLKRGSAPSTTSFDYRSAVIGNSEGLSVTNPLAGDWYVMARGFKAYANITLKAVLTAKTQAQITSADTDNSTALKRMIGSYDGLLGDGAIRLLGRMELTVGTGGVFSCKALLDGVAYGFTGKLDADGRWKGFIKVGGVPMPVGLVADLVGQLIIKGSVGWDGIQYEVFAMRQTLGAPDQAGIYPVTLWPNSDESGSALPVGNGLGTLTVKKDGTATMTGKLGDDTQITASGHLSTDGKWALYSPLYNKTGAIGGWWIFEPWKTSQKVKGSLRWIKSADASQDGFNGLVTGEGAMNAQ